MTDTGFLSLANDIAAQLRNGLKSDVFGGVAAAGLLTGALGFLVLQLRSVPGKIAALIERHFVLTLTLREDDDAYHTVSLWLSRHPSSARARNFQIVQKRRYGGISETHPGPDGKPDADFYRLTPGLGMRAIRHAGRWWLVDRSTPSNGPTTTGQRPQETLVLRTLGRNRQALVDLLNEITEPFIDKSDVTVYFWRGSGYSRVNERALRPLDSVHVTDGAKERIVADIERFRARQSWYAERGVPWRRGYLLKGPPGTGKSSLVLALAGHFKKSIYVIQPSMVASDASLHEALNSAGAGFVVIEDADTFTVTRRRRDIRATAGSDAPAHDAPAFAPRPPPSHTTSMHDAGAGENDLWGVTLSGLLNAIDGIASDEGRILFVTTNAADSLDPALLRPGRLDRHETIGLADEAVARAMFARWFPGADADAFVAALPLPMAQAALQERLIALAEADNPARDLQDGLADAVAKEPTRDAA